MHLHPAVYNVTPNSTNTVYIQTDASAVAYYTSGIHVQIYIYVNDSMTTTGETVPSMRDKCRH